MSDEDFYRDVVRHAPRMTSLLGAEFNFDWRLDWPDAEAVLTQDIDEAPLADNQALQTELDYLVGMLGSERLADGFVAYVDSGLVPLADTGRSTREWLIDVRDRVSRVVVLKAESEGYGQLGEAV